MTKLSAENSDAKNILIGVSGGISAYKIPFLVRTLKKRGHQVKVILTSSAKNLVGEGALKTLTGFPVYSDDSGDYDINHIRLEEWADLFILAPATANTIAKMTHGIADNLLCTTILALTCPIIVVPAMNTAMWENAATQTNIKTLKERGAAVLPVAVGQLACGTIGAGRMIEIDDIAEYAALALQKIDLYGKFAEKTICIASGPTQEPIDAVRCITNYSSGKMGCALARAAVFAGARVIVVSGQASAKMPEGIELINVNTASQMHAAMIQNLPQSDIVIMAAAVSDFRVENIADTKILRENNTQYTLNLAANPDIAEEIGRNKTKEQKLVVFSLETDDKIERGIEKMKRKNADLCVFNNAANAVGKDDSQISIICKDGQIFQLSQQSKTVSAAKILELL